MRKSARAAAAALGLSSRPFEDRRVDLYEGASLGCRITIATFVGVTLQRERPRLEFQRNPVLAIVVLFPGPLPWNAAATTLRMAPRQFETGDFAFDQFYKLTASDPEAARRLFEPQEIRDALMSLYGREKNPIGSGILIEIDANGLLVRYHEARPRRAEQIARAALAAAVKLGQRVSFLQ